MQDIWFWVIFNAVVVALLVIDMNAFHKKARAIALKEALTLSAFWIAIALSFAVFIYYSKGKEAFLNFLTGYLVEKSLSVDNLFVFALIFSYFNVHKTLLHKVLFWGVLGAIVMRAFFILFGIALIQQFHWLLYIFGFFIIFVGIKLALQKDKKIHPEDNFVLKIVRRFIPMTDNYSGDKFFVKRGAKYFATPLFAVLIAIETTDVVFAVDSIPAIIGITTDPFIVYSSNILAVLGLRSLYFALAHLITLFHYINYGLAFILVFIGVKMVVADFIAIPTWIALLIVIAALLLAIFASWLYPPKKSDML